MSVIRHQQITAKLLLDWWYFTGKEYFLDYAIKTVALFDREGKREVFKVQCRRALDRFSPHRKQIGFKRIHPSVIVDIQDGWFDSSGRWIGKEYDELCLEAIHSALLTTYGLK